jgi:importin-7
VYLKNRIYTSYSVDLDAPPRSTPGSGPIAPSDKEAIKRSLLPLLSSSPSRGITLQLSHALKNVVARDFPEQWPTLLNDVKQMLGSGNIREIASGCVAALEIVRAFR